MSLPISVPSALSSFPTIGLGLYLSFKPPTPPKVSPPSTPNRAHDTTLLGLSLSAFGFEFLFAPSLHHLNLPPLHLALGTLALTVLLTQRRKREDPYTRVELLCLAAGELLPLISTYAFSYLSNTEWMLRPNHPFTLSNINLPWPLTIHMLGLTFVGLYKAFEPPSPDPSEPDYSATGVMAVGLGLSYLLTSSAPIVENQWVAASAPVRILMGALAVALLVVKKPHVSNQTRGWLWAIIPYDAISGVVTGRWLGNMSGTIRA